MISKKQIIKIIDLALAFNDELPEASSEKIYAYVINALIEFGELTLIKGDMPC